MHHSRTNHVLEGETHVPAMVKDSDTIFKLREMIGEGPFTAGSGAWRSTAFLPRHHPCFRLPKRIL